LNLGGAFNDAQEAGDEMNSDTFSQWLSIGSDDTVTGSSWLTLSSAKSGDSQNNTTLNIVGYLTKAYDCLPSGHGYWDESICTPTGSVYISAVERAKLGTSIDDQDDYTRKISDNGLTNNNYFIRLTSNAENIRVMGITFYTTNNTIRGFYFDQQLYGSGHILHCNYIINSVTNGYDCLHMY
jgi:hypothetical protein